MSSQERVTQSGSIPIVVVAVALACVALFATGWGTDVAPLLAPFIYLCVVALSLLVMIRSIRSDSGTGPLAAASSSTVDGRPAGRLEASEILSLEFEYARETAAQAMGDRQALVNFYLAISGALPTAVAVLLSQGMPVERLKDYRAVGVWALWALVVVGWLFFLKMIRLREAHSGSLKAMNAIKDFYLSHVEGFDREELADAFLWRTGSMPRSDKKWNVFYLSAVLIAFLNSLTFALGGLLMQDANTLNPMQGPADSQTGSWPVFAVYGLLMLGLHLGAYSALLAPKGGVRLMSTNDRKLARPARRVEILEQSREHDGYFKIDRVRLRFERFDGRLSEPVTRQVVERGDSVCVLPFDPASNSVLLIQQFRYPAYVRGGPGWLWEIVAGMQDKGRDRVTVAHAELLEEAGYQIGKLAPIAQFYPSPGGLSERMYLYLGYISAADRVTAGGGLPSENEDIRVALFALPEALSMMDSGEICDAKTIVALQWLALHRSDLP
jgi:nudix-type nucleoside diphosphatase (YffH/AdpP family)